MPSITSFAYSAIADKLGLDLKNEAAAIAKYLEPNSSFRAQVEGWIEDVYKTVAGEFEDETSNVLNGEDASINSIGLARLVERKERELLEQLQERYDRDYRPNWVVTVSWSYPGEFEVTTGQTFKETKLVCAESRGQAAEKACNACGLDDDPLLGWHEVNPQYSQKLVCPPIVVAQPFDEWVRSNTVLA